MLLVRAADRRRAARDRAADDPARAARLRRRHRAQLSRPRDGRAGEADRGRDDPSARSTGPHASTPAELKQRLEAERRGTPFLLFRDEGGHQQIVELDDGAPRVTIGRRPENDIALRVGRGGLARARPARAGRPRLVADRRRDLAQRLLRQRRAARPPAPPARRRPALLRRDARAVPRAGPRGVALDRRRLASARPTIPLTETASARCSSRSAARCRARAYAAPATNREIAAEVHLSVDAVKAHLRVVFERARPRRPAAEPEARAARRGRARQRPRATKGLLMLGCAAGSSSSPSPSSP